MPKLAKLVSRALGVVFVAIGLVTFAVGEEIDRSHNLLHLATGVIACYFGFVASLSTARTFCRIFGGGYLAFGIIGVLMGDPQTDRLWHVGPLHLGLGDHLFHVVLGGVILAGGILTTVKTRQRTFHR